MKTIFSYSICTIAGLFIFLKSYAQKSPDIPAAGVEITKAIPASPDAASLGKYGSIPVSPYTGVPNISIPFYTIKSGQISLPISLSYHSGGNKIDEMASSVGLGWTLNAGGAIVRTIRGFADEQMFGFLDPNHFVYNIEATLNGGSNYNNADLNEHLNQIADGTVDGQSDVYNFNFAGYSGKFVLDNFGNVMVMPTQNIKFSFDIASGSAPYIRDFTAKTPDGTTYVFGSNNDGNDAIEKTLSINSCSTSASKTYVATSWFIKKITDALGHSVTFNYIHEQCDLAGSATQTKYQFQSWDGSAPSGSSGSPQPTPSDQNCTGGGTVQSVKLSTITFENGHLSVYANTTRNDVAGGNTAIDSIAIAGPGFLKSYHLYYTNSSTARLRLDSLISKSGVLAVNKERYAFQYNSDSWSATNKYNQDYWGYNNGHTENTSLVPWALFYTSGSSTPVKLDGAERGANESSMMGGMLTSVTYPTGGVTTFTYEANSESNIPFSSINTNSLVTSAVHASNDPNSGDYNITSNGNLTWGFYTVYSNANATQVNIESSGFNIASNPNNHITGSFCLVDTNGITQQCVGFDNTIKTIVLPNGYYKLSISDPKHEGYTSSNTTGVKYDAEVGWSNDTPPSNGGKINSIVGGLRIRQIVDYDGIHNNPVNIKTYKYLLSDQITSSGWLDYQPVYSYSLGMNVGDYQSGFSTTTFFVRTSTSNYPLATTAGSVVGYSHVEEDLVSVNGQNGKNEYFYSNSQSTPDLTFGGFPFAPPMSLDWRRGLLLKQVAYSQNANNYFKVQEKDYTYTYDHQKFNNEIVAGLNPKPAQYGENTPYYTGPSVDGKLLITPFTDYTDFNYMTSETIKNYSSNDTTKFVQTVTNFAYDTVTLQVNKLTSINSKNETVIKSVTYPNNYIINPIAPGNYLAPIFNLQTAGITTVPVEEVTQKQNSDGSNLRTVNAVFNTYKAATPTLRDSVYEMRSIGGLTGFVKSSSNGVAFVKDSHYQPVASFDKYDFAGNILQERKVGDAIHSYLWAYPDASGSNINTFPVAEVINADTTNIAYTNFESYPTGGYGSGNWNYYNNSNITTDTYAPMGINCYSLSGGRLSKGGLNSSTNYILSVWVKQGGAVLINGNTIVPQFTGNTIRGWIYQQYALSGVSSVIVTGAGLIDELRLYPSNALMSTYTYSPLAGMTAKCDTKSEITTYAYDNLGRLATISDKDGNIIKKNDYHYTPTLTNLQNLTPYIPPAAPVCTGEGYKFVNGVCTYGTLVLVSDIYRNGIYYATYYYSYSDGTKSQIYHNMSFSSMGYNY